MKVVLESSPRALSLNTAGGLAGGPDCTSAALGTGPPHGGQHPACGYRCRERGWSRGWSSWPLPPVEKATLPRTHACVGCARGSRPGSH